MILVHFTPTGEKRVVDLQDLFAGQTCFLVGGSPSLLQQPLRLLESRGVLTMAINNAARHFQPTLWVSGDPPGCYEPQILKDPRITKFAPLHAAEQKTLDGSPYTKCPNLFFYSPDGSVAREDYLKDRRTVPWYNNTLSVGIYILYRLGIRRIILAGSDFGAGPSTEQEPEGSLYAHATSLSALERKWNTDLYNDLVKELRMQQPYFESMGLEVLDASVHSRLAPVYRQVSLEDAVQLATTDFPKEMVDPKTLPHCSKFAPQALQERIASWPGYQTIDIQPFKEKPNA